MRNQLGRAASTKGKASTIQRIMKEIMHWQAIFKDHCISSPTRKEMYWTMSRKWASQTEIFNHHCRIVNFIEYIKQACGTGTEACIDLMDEAGNLMNLSGQQNSLESASNILTARRRYILIKMSKQDDSETVKYEALLDNIEHLHPAVADQLRKLSNPKAKEKKEEALRKLRSKEVILSPPSKNKSAFKPKNSNSAQRRS